MCSWFCFVFLASSAWHCHRFFLNDLRNKSWEIMEMEYKNRLLSLCCCFQLFFVAMLVFHHWIASRWTIGCCWWKWWFVICHWNRAYDFLLSFFSSSHSWLLTPDHEYRSRKKSNGKMDSAHALHKIIGFIVYFMCIISILLLYNRQQRQWQRVFERFTQIDGSFWLLMMLIRSFVMKNDS